MAISYSISGGADAGKFNIDSATGKLTFKAAPDFEAPGDANTDNVYEVQVKAADAGGASSTQDMRVTVTDVSENAPPQITSAATVSVKENQTTVMTVTATDPDDIPPDPVPPDGDLAAPVIKTARTASSSHPDFMLASGSSTISNHLKLYGTAKADATITTSTGATAKADGSGNWVIDLGVLSDGAKSITATTALGGKTSPASSAFAITINPTFKAFSQVATYGEIPFTHNYKMYAHSKGAPYSIQGQDGHAIRFEIRQGDHTPSDSNNERSEIAGGNPDTLYPDNKPQRITFEFYQEPGPPSGGKEWALIWQYWMQGGSPPIAICFCGPEYWTAGDHLCVRCAWASAAGQNATWWNPYLAPAPLPRGVWHSVEIEMKTYNQDPGGYLRVWLDGQQIVDYTGKLGYGAGENHQEYGWYRGPSAPDTQIVTFRNYITTLPNEL